MVSQSWPDAVVALSNRRYSHSRVDPDSLSLEEEKDTNRSDTSSRRQLK
ncbi:MAG: hypothetical protein WBE46_00200 [Dehalococcoidia bacterium]